jgi:hypothetical protein
VTQTRSQLDNNIYRLVLIAPDARHCLTESINGSARLPRVAIPKRANLADEISRLLLDSWGLRAVILDLLTDACEGSGCVIAELFGSEYNSCPFLNSAWRSIADVASGDFCETELVVVEQLIASGSTGRGVFSRLRWIDDAITWLASEVPDEDFRFSGEFQQLNANAAFSLVRFGNTRGRPYWLKAVGEPNLHELPVTQTLARTFPNYLPEFVAGRTDWNAWIMKDAGSRLTEPPVRHEVESAVMSLAALQKAAIGHEEALLPAGCFDQRGAVLRKQIPQLIQYLVDAMARQTSTKTPRVPELRLRELGSILLDVCIHMEALDLPATLIHNDFGFGNILFDGSQSVLTDWAEACIGIPTVTYQHLKHYLSREAEASAWLPELDGIYKRSWKDVISDNRLEKALLLSPLLALASHLLGRGTWMNSRESQDPSFQQYARGLARHMDQMAAAPELAEVLCS